MVHPLIPPKCLILFNKTPVFKHLNIYTITSLVFKYWSFFIQYLVL